jgi:CelD/BcsL family acetyltransferase involved in cellulose biosynthesis
MRRAVLARSHHDIYRLRYSWDQLDSRSSATMFQSFTWNYTAALTFSDREEPHVIFAETGHGSALLPLAIDQSQKRLTFLGETLFDYRDVLSTGDPQVLACAWNRAAQLDLKFSSGAVRSDSNFAAWEGFDVSGFYGAPRVSPKEISADEFASAHHRLPRSFRRLEREGVQLKCHTGENSDLVRHIYRHKGSQPSEAADNLFRDSRRVQFMIEVCRRLASACEIFTLESAGTLVAALVTFRDRHVRRFYTIYFDHVWAKYSPGMILVYEVTRRSLKASLECDYMTGEHGYKTRLATSIVPMYWVEASPGTLSSLGQVRLPSPALAA